MTLSAAIEVARLGASVRRSSWPLSRYLSYSAGQGAVRAVALYVDGTTVQVLRASHLSTSDRDAIDWVQMEGAG